MHRVAPTRKLASCDRSADPYDGQMPTIDVNSDLGESFGTWVLGDDEAMLDVVTSANVACGFHAGDPSTLRRVCSAAVERRVVIGAQVSFPDLAGFGRRHMHIDSAELSDIVLYQLGALDAFARVAGSRVRYVKPHGALYHAAATDERVARAVVDAVRTYDASLPVMGLPRSKLHSIAEEAGIVGIPEAFADRAYEPNGQLVSRGSPGAVLADADVIARRVVRMAVDGCVDAIDGSQVDVDARSICVHGDTPGAVAIARAVRNALDAAGVDVEAFAP